MLVGGLALLGWLACQPASALFSGSSLPAVNTASDRVPVVAFPQHRHQGLLVMLDPYPRIYVDHTGPIELSNVPNTYLTTRPPYLFEGIRL